jgi:circadian clock protein KaiC
MAHSNQIREFRLTDRGIQLTEVYLGPEGILMGSARAEREAQDRLHSLARTEEQERLQRHWRRRQTALEAEIARLRAGFESEMEEELVRQRSASSAETARRESTARLAQLRHADDHSAVNGRNYGRATS